MKRLFSDIKGTLPGLCACAAALALSSCAQVVAPGGGPVDRTPPKVLKYTPDSAQLAFNTRTIEIVFDEYIQLKDLAGQLIISPPLNKTPDISIRNKTLVIQLDKDESLRPNTTYSIFFGNAVQDLNENNPKENFRYIFSTGAFIDSLSVKGKVENAFDHKTEKGVLVALYSNMNDSMPLRGQPDYFTRTLGDGTFSINNVRQGSYRIAAIRDLNANYRYDGDAELIAFSRDTVFSARKENMQLFLFQEKPEKIRLKKYMHDQFGKVSLYFDHGSDSIRVTALNNTGKGVQEFIEFSRNKDTLSYWIKNFEKDSLFLQVSNGNIVLDTVELKMIKKEDALKSKRRPLKLRVVNSLNGIQTVDPGKPLRLTFSQPPAPSHDIKAIMKEDTTLIKGLIFSQSGEGLSSMNIFYCCDTFGMEDPMNPGTIVSAVTMGDYILKPDKKYELFIPPGTFSDIFGISNDSIRMSFKTREEKYYGSLVLNMRTGAQSKSYIIQLLNEREQVVQENVTGSGERRIEYIYLPPGKYKVKLIYDENGNRKWDTGNYKEGLQPEKVIYNAETIMIRSNWDAEVEWDLAK